MTNQSHQGEGWRKRFDEKFVVLSNAKTPLLRYTDASLIKSFISSEIAQARSDGYDEGYTAGKKALEDWANDFNPSEG